MAPHFFIPRSRLFALVLFAASLFVVVDNYGQNGHDDPKFKTYLIIGAFSVESNANRLIELVKEYDFDAEYRKNENRGLYYVYIQEASDKNAVMKKAISLREKYTQFYDAWAYTGNFTEPKEKPKKPDQSHLTSFAGPQMSTKESDNSPEESKPDKDNAVEKSNEPTKEKAIEIKDNHYYFYFNAINSKNLKEVKGNVNIIDVERAKQLLQAKSHKLVELQDPDNGTRRVKVATNMFGFREVQYTLDLDDSLALSKHPEVELAGDSIIVDFELKRFKKGDILIMYNVYFFKDAAIMKPESIYELNALLDMLKENENLVVKIHGHTNGNSHGKIIHLDLEDKNFFGINGEHKESRGSAKKLSLYRAYTIQHWLMDQGIEEERMEIKGWGGKQMIYDKHSTQADKNVRVEIEILQE